MTDPHRLDEAALRGLDDQQLEVIRFQLLTADDVRYEHVVEHLLVRGITAIETLVGEIGGLRGISAQQQRNIIADASVRLQLRLPRRERLASVDTLAWRIAVSCLDEVSPGPTARPRLAPRRPQLRTVHTELSAALRDGRIKRNRGGQS